MLNQNYLCRPLHVAWCSCICTKRWDKQITSCRLCCLYNVWSYITSVMMVWMQNVKSRWNKNMYSLPKCCQTLHYRWRCMSTGSIKTQYGQAAPSTMRHVYEWFLFGCTSKHSPSDLLHIAYIWIFWEFKRLVLVVFFF